MEDVNLDLFFERLIYYPLTLVAIAIAGLLGYLFIPREQRRNVAVQLSLGIIVLVACYELLAAFLSAQKMVNLWVYNLFNSHVAVILFLLLIRSFLKKKSHKKAILYSIVIFLLISIVLHLIEFVQFNGTGEYLSFLNSILILCACGLYFFELITLDEFLDINPLKEYSFWASTAILFYFSASFMVYISYQYLYTYHLDIYYMVIKIPIHLTLVSNLLLCFSIYSLVLKERFHFETIHV